MAAKRGRHGSDGRPRPHRLDKMRSKSLKPSGETVQAGEGEMRRNVAIDCGWGRLFFAQTFDDIKELTEALVREQPGCRDIAFYLSEPHVALALAPQELFLDPSHAFRLDLSTYRPARQMFRGFTVRRLCSEADAHEVNRIYAARHMVQVDPAFYWKNRDNRHLVCLVAEDKITGAVLGSVTGVDHRRAFNDPEHGSSLWCLAVDPQAPHPRVGEALVRHLAEHFAARGAGYMDLSVMHDNEQAIALYEKLGFERLPFFALKNKNSINEKLFSGPSFDTHLNPYAQIIVDEARRRGIAVDILDSEMGYFRLTFGGRSVVCRESLTELTTAIAMSRCADKAVTRRLLGAAGLYVPAQINAVNDKDCRDFLTRYGRVVVKPADGEQGRGVIVDIQTDEALKAAVAQASARDDHVLVEEFIEGEDLRIIVIGFEVVAAALRKPPQVVGDGRLSIRTLIEKQSRRRAAATSGESNIPLDDEARRVIAAAGYALDDILPAEQVITVRKAANLHSGGTIHDVTDSLHPVLAEAAITAARTLDIPVVGLDMMVQSPDQPDYVIIEANERPGLANHEPQPTAERLIDLLFPHSAQRETRPRKKAIA